MLILMHKWKKSEINPIVRTVSANFWSCKKYHTSYSNH